MNVFAHLRLELKLALRGMYFYIEIIMAIVLLVILLVFIPQNFNQQESEYIYIDLPEPYYSDLLSDIKEDDADHIGKAVVLKDSIDAVLYESEDHLRYILSTKEDMLTLAQDEKHIGAVINLDTNGHLHYDYYLQGYESQKLKNLLLILHNKDLNLISDTFDTMPIIVLEDQGPALNDREFMVPSFLTFNGALIGLFIIAAYIFLDKQEGTIRAIAVTPSTLRDYLLSKALLLIIVSNLTSLLITIPVMGTKPNYLLFLLFLSVTGFFASSLGLLIASFYDDMIHAFGMIFIFVVLMMLPNIAYFMPSWSPIWIRIFPSYGMIEGFSAIIKGGQDLSYIMGLTAIYGILGVAIFAFANNRFKKTLTL